jgi:hypothetical protein
MAANPTRGQHTRTPTESDGLTEQAQDQLVMTQRKVIEAVMTMQEPMTDAVRKTFAMAGDVISTGQRIAPVDKLLDIQLELVRKLFDLQVDLAKVIFEAQSDLMMSTRRILQTDGTTSSQASASSMIDLGSRPDEPAMMLGTK